MCAAGCWRCSTSLWQQAPFTVLKGSISAEMQLDQQTNPQDCKHHWSEFGSVWVGEGQRGHRTNCSLSWRAHHPHSRARPPSDWFNLTVYAITCEQVFLNWSKHFIHFVVWKPKPSDYCLARIFVGAYPLAILFLRLHSFTAITTGNQPNLST